jgi:hypothetical protein
MFSKKNTCEIWNRPLVTIQAKINLPFENIQEAFSGIKPLQTYAFSSKNVML